LTGNQIRIPSTAEPRRNFLGVEVHRPGIGHLLRAAAAANLANLRVIEQDAVEVLRSRIAPEALDEAQILFPDPWPKKRHHKRRLVQPEFAELVATRLTQGGRFKLATDWEPYAEQMRLVLGGCPLLEYLDSAGSASRTPTRFERRGTDLGLRVHDFAYRRR